MGFKNIYRYEGGKEDWRAEGLPTEGRQAGTLKAAAFTRKDLPTCELTDSVNAAKQRMEGSGHEFCVVVNPQSVVIGRVRKKALEEARDGNIEDVMEEGPTTIRPGEDLIGITNRMQDARAGNVLVTTSDGVLLGALYREDAEEAIHASHAGVRV